MLEEIFGYINIGLWVCLFLAMLFAFLRGFRKSISRLIATIIVILLSFLFTNALSKVMCTFDLGRLFGQDSISLASLIEQTIKENFELETIANDSALKEFCLAAAQSFVKIPIFLCIYSVLIIIFRPLIAIIIRTIIPFPKGKTLGMRFIGVGVCVINFFIVVWFWTFAVLGIKGVVQQCLGYYNDIAVIENQERVEQEKSELEEIESALELFDDGSFIKVLSIFSGEQNNLEAKLLGKVTTIKTTNGKLNIVREIENIKPIVDIIKNVQDKDENALIEYLLNNKELILDALESSEIINVALPIGIEILDYIMVEFSAEGLEEVVWTEEKVDLINVVRVVLNAVVELKLDVNDPISVLENQSLPVYLGEIGKALEKTDLVKKCAMYYLNDILQEALGQDIVNEYPVLLEVLDLTKIDLENDLSIVGSILVDAKKIGIFDEDIKIINNQNVIVSMLKSIFDLSTIKGNESKIIEAILDITELTSKFESAGLIINLNISNWDNEIDRLASVLNLIFMIAEEQHIDSFDDIDVLTLMENAIDTPTFDQLLDAICSSELLNKSLINLIDSLLNKNDLSNIKSEKFNSIINGELTLDISELKNELKLLLRETKEIISMINGETIEVAKVETVILNLCDSTYINVQEIIKIVFDEFINGNNVFEKQIILPNLSNNEWKEEVKSIFEIIDIIQENNYLDEEISLNSETIQNILKLTDLMNQSEIFRQILPDLISNVIQTEDFLSEWLLSQCGINEDGTNKLTKDKESWSLEISKFEEIYDYYKANNIDEIDFDNLTNNDYQVAEDLFLRLNQTYIINMNGIVTKINSALEDNNFDFKISGMFDRNNNNTTTDEWAIEIPKLFDYYELYDMIGEFSNDILKSKSLEIGNLLEGLEKSYLFGNDTKNDGTFTTDDNVFNDLVFSILKSVNLIKNTDNPNGFIDENQAKITNWDKYNWVVEIEILASFDVSQETQTINTMKLISSSEIIKDFFDIASFLNEKLDSKTMVITKGDFTHTLVLKDIINGGKPFTNEDLRTRNWTLELESFEQISDVFDAGYTPDFKAKIEEIIALNNHTFAVETAASIKNNLQNLSYFGTSVWDII